MYQHSQKPEIDVRNGMLDGTQVYLIRFAYSKEIIGKLKELKIARWNPDIKCWMMPRDKQRLQLMEKHLLPVADTKFYNDLPDEIYTSKSPEEKKKEVAISKQQVVQRQKLEAKKELPEVLQKDIEKWLNKLTTQRYSPDTLSVYHSAALQFFYWLGEKHHREVRKEDVEAWMHELVTNRNCSFSYQNQHINALRSFYSHIFSIHLSVDMIERPRPAYHLPRYFTKEETANLLSVVKNVKHKCMLSLVYACGLRAGDLIGAKISDIDASQRLLIIRGGKGKRDRTVPVPQKLLEQLAQYGQTYKPETYLFEGEKPGAPYSKRSLQQVFKRAVKDSGLPSEATLHWLRHSYATHLLEQGTNTRLIQQLLGHRHLKTTEIYTHVSKISFQQVTSPFETLDDDTDEKKLTPFKPGKWLKE